MICSLNVHKLLKFTNIIVFIENFKTNNYTSHQKKPQQLNLLIKIIY